MTDNSFPDRLKALRTVANLSQAQFAKKLLISRGLLNGLETGREKPSEWIVQQVNMLERMGVDLLDKIVPTPHGKPGSMLTVGERSAGTSDLLRKEILTRIGETIRLAGDDIGKLGWIREQVIRHASAPEHWDILEKVVEKNLTRERQREKEEAARERDQSTRAHGKAS